MQLFTLQKNSKVCVCVCFTLTFPPAVDTFPSFRAPNMEHFGNAADHVLIWKHFSVDEGKGRLLETPTPTLTFTSWSGFISHDVSFPDLSRSYKVTLSKSKLTASASIPSRECSMDNDLHAFYNWIITLLSFRAPLVQLKSDFIMLELPPCAGG